MHKELNDSYLVTKSNNLIEASYKLTVNEQKLVLIVASLVEKDDEDFKNYNIQVKKVADLLNLDTKNSYRELKKITRNLMSKVITMYVPNEKKEGVLDTIQVSWFSSVRYVTGEGNIIARFDPDMKPFLLSLKEHFTSYKLNNIIQLRSSYSIRIYEILKQYEKIGFRDISIDKLKEMLGIEKNKYTRYNNFKQKVINVAYEEINENTDINFGFEEIKRGRKVDKIKFIIKSNADIRRSDVVESEVAVTVEESILAEENLYIEKLKEFIEEDLSVEEYKAILNVAKNDITKIKEKYEVAKVSNFNNLMAFLISAIVGDYKMPIKNSRAKNSTNNFNNFKQRTDKYSSEELEEMIRRKKS